MDCDALRDDQWERIRGFVPGGTKGKRGPRTNNRRFLDALLWMARSGGRWRDLPERLGDYRSVKRRYYRWIEMGVLDDDAGGSGARSRSGMADDRFDHCAGASARRRRAQGKRGADAQGLGRSRGGLSTKIHAASDALGNPVRLIGTPGQRNDIAFAHELVDGITAERHDRRQGLRRRSSVQADRRNRGQGRHTAEAKPQDTARLRRRTVQRAQHIERFFNKLKQFRRVATRYDKLLANFMGFVKLAALAIWLK